MREMLDDEICKVCGRPALRGTEEYKFMEGKLHEYIRHMQEEADIKAEELKEKPLFEGRAIEDLHAMSISFGGTTAMEIAKKYQEVKDLIEFVDDRKMKNHACLYKLMVFLKICLIKISMILKATLNNAIEPSSVFLTIRLR